MASGFRFGSPSSDSVAAVAKQMPPAINLFSWDDMCREGGGLTAIIFIAILIVYLIVRYHILISEEKDPTTDTSPLYDHRDRQNQSIFRRFMLKLEKIFVLPFVPSKLDSMVMWMFMWFIATTIPMAIERHYNHRWAHDVITTQGPLNMIGYWVFNCKSLDTTAIPYTKVIDEYLSRRFFPPPKEDKSGRIDYFFSLHLAVGIMWLLVGFIQIFKAKSGGWSLTPNINWNAHRVFGKVGIAIVIAHICMTVLMTLENPVNQRPIIRFAYTGMVIHFIFIVCKGVKYARKTVRSSPLRVADQTNEERSEYSLNRKKHEMYMFFLYVRTTSGSGTIRVTSWVLWLVGQFLKPETRVIIDRGACQTYTEHIGDATDCWKPVCINLVFTDVVMFWMEVLFLTMKNNLTDLDPASRKLWEKQMKKTKSWFELKVIILVLSIPLWFADRHVKLWNETSSLPYFLGLVLENITEISALLWFIVVHYSDHIMDVLNDHVHDPIDRSYTSTVKSFFKTIYRLDEDEDEHEHVD